MSLELALGAIAFGPLYPALRQAGFTYDEAVQIITKKINCKEGCRR